VPAKPPLPGSIPRTVQTLSDACQDAAGSPGHDGGGNGSGRPGDASETEGEPRERLRPLPFTDHHSPTVTPEVTSSRISGTAGRISLEEVKDRQTVLKGLQDEGSRRGVGNGSADVRCPAAFRGTLASMTLNSSVIGLATAAILYWQRNCRPAAGTNSLAAGQTCLHIFAIRPSGAATTSIRGHQHYGVDLPAPAGAPVLATAPGKVIRVQKKGPGGLEVLVQHDGFMGIYSHLGMLAPHRLVPTGSGDAAGCGKARSPSLAS
jgi:Peptidase family M23